MSKDNSYKIEEFPDKVNKFINDQTKYYRSSIHWKYCQICHLPANVKTKINKMLLSGEPMANIELYIVKTYPEIFHDRPKLHTTLINHRKYLPYLLEDVAIKTIFKRARHFIENKDLTTMDNDEKARLISDIEEEIIKEYEDIENDRISMLNLLFKETVPLMLTRLHHEIVQGKAADIKYITDASQVIWKISASMISHGAKTNDTEEDIDYDSLDEKPSNNNRQNILSLTDKINKATKGTG